MLQDFRLGAHLRSARADSRYADRMRLLPYLLLHRFAVCQQPTGGRRGSGSHVVEAYGAPSSSLGKDVLRSAHRPLDLGIESGSKAGRYLRLIDVVVPLCFAVRMRSTRPLSELAAKPTYRTIDGLSIRYVESDRRDADALLFSP